MDVRAEVTGFDELRKLLKDVGEDVAKRVTQSALRRVGERVRNILLINLSGRILKEQSGRLINAFERTKIRLRKDRFGVYGGITLPTRAELTIGAYKSSTDHGYYPTALEYGTKKVRKQKSRLGVKLNPPRLLGQLKPYRYMRRSIDDDRNSLMQSLVGETKKNLEKEWKRQAKQRIGQ